MSETTFGKYDLVVHLGSGGMADVFLAVMRGPEGLGFSKLLVIKRLRANVAEDPEFVSMLIDEARIAARLNHPNVVQTMEIGQVGKDYFMAMEYLDGQPLHRIARRARQMGVPLDPNLVCTLMSDVLAGLHHAHELADYDGTPLSVVHRDISPQNIFVTYSGQAKVVDFGIARASGRVVETRAGIVKGKVTYMAPEQALAREQDRRVDVFAVGVMFWELLTGQRMWQGIDEMAIALKLVSGDIPRSPRAVNGEVNEVLDAMIAKALAPKPEERFNSAAEFQKAIEDYLRGPGRRFSANEIGAFIDELFKEERTEMRATIDARLAELKETSSRSRRIVPSLAPHSAEISPSTRSSMAVPVEVPVNESRRSTAGRATVRPGDRTNTSRTKKSRLLPEEEGAQAADEASPQSREARARPTQPVPRKSFTAAYIATGGTVVVLTVVLLFMKSNAANGGAGVPQPSPTTPTAATQTTKLKDLSLKLTATPANARIRIDDGPALANPYDGKKRLDNEYHSILVEADGYQTETRRVRFDEEVLTLDFQLGKLAGTGTPAVAVAPTTPVAPPVQVGRPTGGGVAKPVVTATTASSSKSLPTAAPTGTGPKRKLDNGDPFE
ncbi:MAG: serine/threonine-protein kinase [Polyangiaceae bacterium]